MPNTPKYAFPYENPPFASPSEEPGKTLHGGSTGTSEILAEKVEEELDRVDTDVQTLEARVTAIEQGLSVPGWTHILSGSNSGSNFDIDLTDGGKFGIGEFDLIRLHMRYDLDATGTVRCRINNDQGGNSYVWGLRAVDAANPPATGGPWDSAAQLGQDVIMHDSTGASFPVGWGATVSTNNLVATFFHMSGNFAHNFQATSNRQSSSATTTVWAESWGALSSTGALSATPQTFRMFCADGATEFAAAWWWVEGYRLP